MTDPFGRRDRPGRRWMTATLVLAALMVGGLGLLVVKPEAGTVPRRVVKQLDYVLLGGLLQRIALGDARTRAADLEVPPAVPGAYDWIDGTDFLAIAHAMGPSLETGRNTVATFRAGLARGFRVFEVDLSLTSDGVLACYHGSAEEAEEPPSWATVRDRAPNACRFEDLVNLALQHPGIRFVLDVKTGFDPAYDRVMGLAEEAGVTASFIPQVYHFSQVRRFRESRRMTGLLFTAYRSALPVDRILEDARTAGVEVVTIPASVLERWNGTLPLEPKVLVHPVNDPFEAARLRARGVDGIYTSYLAPRTVPALFEPNP